MTQLMSVAHLQEIERDTKAPALQPQRLVPVLHWTINSDTRKPVGQWRLEAKPLSPTSR